MSSESNMNRATVGGRIAHRAKTFNARFDWMGPTVAALSVWYLLAQIIVGWVFNPARGSHSGGPEYSFVQNTISDLGNTACGQYGGAQVCSPRYILMDLSFAILGVAMAVGSLLIYREFTDSGLRREKVAALLGFILLAIAGVGTILVGSFPENTNGTLHVTGAVMAIGVGNVGILLLGFALVSIAEGLRHFMLASASVSLVAAISFGMKHHFGLGAGGMKKYGPIRRLCG